MISVEKGKSTKNQYQPSQMFSILSVIKESSRGAFLQSDPTVRIVAIENVHAMPGQGVTSMFSMGYGLGLWIMGCAALKFPIEYVEPGVWKRAMSCGKDKNLSIQRALQLFPSATPQLKRVKDHGRAESLLIAEFLRRKLTGQTFPALK